MIIDATKGDRGTVLLNGSEVEHVQRAEVGLNGWVEQLVFEDGHPKLNAARDAVERIVLHGEVVFERKHD